MTNDNYKRLLTELTNNELASLRLDVLHEACEALKAQYPLAPGSKNWTLAEMVVQEVDSRLHAIEDEMAQRELLIITDEN